MSETSVGTGILTKLRTIPFSEWEKATVTNRAGSQDVKGHIRGWYIAIELKKDNNDGPKPLQKYRITQTNKKGAFSFWASNWKHIERELYTFAGTKGFQLYGRDR
jgi:hypothetical protein